MMVYRPCTRKAAKALVLALFILIAWVPSGYLFVSEFSLKSYQSLIDWRLVNIFFRTILLGLGVTFCSAVLGVVAAFLLECTDLPLKNWLSLLIIIPLLLPPYVSTIGWMAFSGKFGDWSDMKLPYDIYNLQTAILLLSLSYFPLVALLVSYAIRNVDYCLEEVGRQKYQPLKVFRKITLPLVMPHLVLGSLFVFILTISDYGVPSLLRIRVYMTEIFEEFSAFFNMSNAAAFSMPLLLLILIAILAIHYYFKGKTYVTISSFSRRRTVMALTPKQKILGLSYMILLLAFSVFFPLIILLYMSQGRFAEAFATASDAFTNSLWLALVCALLLAGLGFFVAYFRRRLSDPLILSPLAIPSAVVAIGMIKTWNHPYTSFIYATPLILVFGYMARFIPFVAKTFSPFYEQISSSLEETARLSKASFAKIIYTITLPLMKPALVPAFVVGFILSIRELELSLLVTPPGFETLSNRIYTLVHYGDFGLVAALCIMVVVLTIAPVALIVSSRSVLIWVTSNSRK